MTDKKNLWVVEHPIWTALIVVGLILLVLLAIFKTGIFFMFLFCGALTSLFVRLFGPDRLKDLAKSKHMLWLFPVLIVLGVFGSIVSQPIYIWSRDMILKDWERYTNPPTIYYIWNVDSAAFKERRPTVALLNPSEGENEAFEKTVLYAARSVGLQADVLAPYDPVVLDADESFTLIFFQSKVESKMIPNPKADSKKGEPELVEAKVASLEIYVQHISGDNEENVKKASSPKKVEPLVLEDDLSVDFTELVEKFSEATGNPVDRDTVKKILQEQKMSKADAEE